MCEALLERSVSRSLGIGPGAASESVGRLFLNRDEIVKVCSSLVVGVFLVGAPCTPR